MEVHIPGTSKALQQKQDGIIPGIDILI